MRIAIVGGGFCGTELAKKLSRKHDVVLFDTKNYFEYTPSVHKGMFHPEYLRKVRVPFAKFTKAKVVTTPVKAVTPHSVKAGARTYPFDVLVISTGVAYPIFLENKKNVFVVKNGDDALAIHRALKRAKDVLVIGGGLIGTEVAAEIAAKAPGKKLTVVHSHPRLLERNPAKASAYALRFLTDRGATVRFGERVKEHTGKQFITDNGNALEADLAIWCAGVKCDVRFMHGFLRNVFTERGALKVNQHLQLDGFTNIFVGGDITSVAEEKTAHNAELHAHVIAQNIERQRCGEPLLAYTPHSGPLVISLGDYSAITTWKNWAFTGVLQAFLKKAIEVFEILKMKF
jgi:NADH dehydrogenase FAD-containing subunit